MFTRERTFSPPNNPNNNNNHNHNHNSSSPGDADNGTSSHSSTSSRQSAPWSVRAEFTIHRADLRTGSPVPVETASRSATIAATSESTGVRMTYSFTPSLPASAMAPPASYGFQRGNLLFTTTPPPRTTSSLLPLRAHTIPRSYAQQQQHERFMRPSATTIAGATLYPDSGYNSEQLSTSTLPSRQSSDKRCRSTYSIVLSSASRQATPAGNPAMAYPRPWSSYQQQQQLGAIPCCRFSAVPEVCEDCAEAASGGGGRPHSCAKVMMQDGKRVRPGQQQQQQKLESRDVASQTTDIEAQQSPVAQRRKLRRKTASSTTGGSATTTTTTTSTTTSGARSGSSARDELKDTNLGRTSKTPGAAKRSPTPGPERRATDAETTSSASTTTNVRDDEDDEDDEDDDDNKNDNDEDDEEEKPKRTVHIDVYCTGSDDDEDDEDNEEEDDTSSSSAEDKGDKEESATVFQGQDVRISHTQAKSGSLPRGFQDEKAFLKRASERRCASFKRAPMRMPSLASSKGYESDDLLSSLYPSQFSSYSRLRDFESAASSRSGLAPNDDYDSASATSWKDTVSDLESLVNSNSKASVITPCDSFEYGRTTAVKGKNWRSPQIERKHLLQGKMMRDYLEKHPAPGWSSDSSSAEGSESGDSSAEEVGWSFVSSEESTSIVRGKLTLPAAKENSSNGKPSLSSVQPIRQKRRIVSGSTTTDQESSQADVVAAARQSIFRDRIGPFGSASPSPPLSKLESRVTSPFTTPQGERTDHIVKASIFGRVISTFRKPGHHVGPAKNPACSCEHCRRYFEEISSRSRSRSLDVSDRRNGSRAPSAAR